MSPSDRLVCELAVRGVPWLYYRLLAMVRNSKQIGRRILKVRQKRMVSKEKTSTRISVAVIRGSKVLLLEDLDAGTCV